MGGALSRKSSAIVLKREDSRNKMPLPKPRGGGEGGERQASNDATGRAGTSGGASQTEDMETLPRAPSRPPRASAKKSTSGATSETSLAVHTSADGGENEEASSSNYDNNATTATPQQQQQQQQQQPRTPSTEPAVEIAPPEPVIGDGGYLVFTTSSDGTLTLHFSTHEVKDALAYFKPMKIVPAFKYRQNAGRQEIIRKLMNNHRGYYEGFAQFVKAGKEFNSEIYLFRNCKARIYYFTTGTSEVAEVPLEKFIPILHMDFVAVVPPECPAFKGIKKMSSDAFVSTGNKFGCALPLDLISRKSMRVNDSNSPLIGSGKERFSPHS